jgi:hypothetical protein
MINNRKLNLQNLHDDEDIEGLKAFPPPRVRFVITQPHLVKQTAAEMAKFSKNLKVYIYGGAAKGDPPGVHRIMENLTRSHALFDHSNEANSQVIVVTSYQKLHQQHGPNANKRVLMQKFGYTAEQAARLSFGQLRDAKNPAWRADHDLSGLIEEIFLDEAQNSKGLLPSLDSPPFSLFPMLTSPQRNPFPLVVCHSSTGCTMDDYYDRHANPL